MCDDKKDVYDCRHLLDSDVLSNLLSTSSPELDKEVDEVNKGGEGEDSGNEITCYPGDEDLEDSELKDVRVARYGDMYDLDEAERKRNKPRDFTFIPNSILSSKVWSTMISRTLGEGVISEEYGFMVKTAKAAVKSKDFNIFELKLGVKGDER